MLNVIIHVGPGKTGTSAIQNWMLKNREELLKEGIHYPEHNLDDNGISSGNARSLYDVKDKDFTFSKEKAERLMDETTKLGVHTLVLSSEAFFARINDLIAFFDNAQYLYYVRSPLEILESGYNQSVKRHFATAPLKLAKKLQFGNLDKIDKLMTEKPELDITFRLYGKSFFKDGDIVKDFLAQIGYNKPISSGSKPVNLSYSFEALEFKRQLNRLPDAPLHHMLDRFLQSYKGQTTSFSVLEKSEFERYRVSSIKRLKSFNEKVNIENFDAFINYVTNQQQKPIVKQSNELGSEQEICKQIQRSAPELYLQLCASVLADPYFGMRDTNVGRACMANLPHKLKVKNWLSRSSTNSKIEPIALTEKALLNYRKQTKVPKRVSNIDVVTAMATVLEVSGQLKAAYGVIIGAMDTLGAHKKLQNKAHQISVKLLNQK